jgi:hypothetical protein
MMLYHTLVRVILYMSKGVIYMTKTKEEMKGVVLFLITIVLCTISYLRSVEINTVKQLNSTSNQIVYENR